MKYIVNGFSPKMLSKTKNGHLTKFYTITKKEFDEIKKDAISAVGHHTIAKMVGIPNNRFNIQLEKGDEAYIIQTSTGRKNALDSNHYEVSYQKVKILS